MDLDRAKKLRYELHNIPEISENEIKTQELLKKYIKNNSKLKIVKKDGYFYAVHYEGENLKNIAFRADMDALPCENGAYHGCGHDGHSAVLAEFAVDTDGKSFGKNLFFLFQPAEEIGKGAEKCCEMLKKESIAEIYGWHNIPGHKEGNILIHKGSFACASKGLRLIFEGKQCHAAYPETGINPSFVIADIVNKLKDFINAEYKAPVLATIVEIKVGNRNFGISAGTGEISMTIRAQYTEDLQKLQTLLLDYSKSLSDNSRISMTYEVYDEFPATVNSNKLYYGFKDMLTENNVAYEDLAEPLRWSEDFGHYSKYADTLFFGIGDGEDYAALHTSGFEFNDKIIENAINAFNMIAKAHL